MLNKEPAAVLGGLAEIVKAIIPTLIMFGYIQWSGDQVAQVMLLTSVVLSFLTILLTRTQVVPTAIADKQIEVAKASSIDRPNSEIIQQAKETV